MIRAYPARASTRPGGELALHVSTDRPRFRVHLLRWTGRFDTLLVTGWLPGEHVPDGGAADDWAWPAYRIPIPDHVPSGACIAWCETDGAPPPTLAMTDAAALFVISGSGHAPLLYKLPLATYHAYNHSGGGCYYDRPPWSDDPPGGRVSLRRPGGGIGGPVFGAADHYDPATPRSGFVHWDAPFIAWLYRQGYEPEFCTDFDLIDEPGLCQRYRLLVSAGHDEYWSEAARDGVEAFVRQGGNVAFFGGNTCWWRIRLVDSGTAMVCHQGGPHGARDSWSGRGGAGRPEDALTGLSYRHGGGWWDGPRVTQGYTVERADHWAFDGTGLHRGDMFGAQTLPPLPGYECDGAPLAQLHPARLTPGASDFGTPQGLELLAVAPLEGPWQELPPRERLASGEGIHASCIATYTRGGTVFNTGSTDWPQVAASGQEPVATITRNAIAHLLREDPR